MLLGAAAVAASSRVIYVADQDTDEVYELHHVDPKTFAVTKLNSPLVANRGREWVWYRGAVTLPDLRPSAPAPRVSQGINDQCEFNVRQRTRRHGRRTLA